MSRETRRIGSPEAEVTSSYEPLPDLDAGS